MGKMGFGHLGDAVMEKTYTKADIEAIMYKAFLELIEEAEEWGQEKATMFYGFSTGASAMIYHISRQMEASDEGKR